VRKRHTFRLPEIQSPLDLSIFLHIVLDESFLLGRISDCFKVAVTARFKRRYSSPAAVLVEKMTCVAGQADVLHTRPGNTNQPRNRNARNPIPKTATQKKK